jgi:hypothetical protein
MRPLPLSLIACAGLAGAAWIPGSLSTASAAPARAQDPVTEEEEALEEPREPEEIRAELDEARRERELLAAQHAAAAFEHEMRTAEAQFALESAQAELDAFETHGLRAAIAAAELELARGGDDVQDADEEMQQLAQLYGENELAERTAEIVLQRARRSLERARAELKLAEEEHRHQVQVALPVEQRALRQAVHAAAMDLRLADFELGVMRLAQRNEAASLEERIHELEAELEEAEAAAEEER